MRVLTGRATIRSTLWVNFVHGHMWDTVVIMDKGSHPLPCFPKFDMFVTWRELNARNQATVMCYRGEEMSRKKRREEEVRRRTAVDFQAYGRPL